MGWERKGVGVRVGWEAGTGGEMPERSPCGGLSRSDEPWGIVPSCRVVDNGPGHRSGERRVAVISDDRQARSADAAASDP